MAETEEIKFDPEIERLYNEAKAAIQWPPEQGPDYKEGLPPIPMGEKKLRAMAEHIRECW